MRDYHFVSYSTVDSKNFVRDLNKELKTAVPPVHTWIDSNNINPGEDFAEAIEKAIPACTSFIYVVSPDSVAFKSECRRELDFALACKRPIVPVRIHLDARVPYRITNYQHIDFTGAFEAAVDKLKQHLVWLVSPEGVLNTLNKRLESAMHDVHHTQDDTQRIRIQKEIEELERQILDQEGIVSDPAAAAKGTRESISQGLERERLPETSKPPGVIQKFINPPPAIAPSYFQDRDVETKLVVDFLRDDARRIITVVGRGGIGKTVMVCRVLRELENGRIQDNGNSLPVDGIVYLSAIGLHPTNMPNLFSDLCKLAPIENKERLEGIYRNPQYTTKDKMETLLDLLRTGRVVVLLDNFEDLVDPESQRVCDGELTDALKALLNASHHAVKVIITTRVAPADLAVEQPARQVRLDLDEGLPSPFAENVLRAMDVDGKIGLKSAPDKLLQRVQASTRGYPRALEALFGILSIDRGTSLEQLLDDAGALLPDSVVEVLVGRAFDRLDDAARRIMQALAIYARPVPSVAIDFLLQPIYPSVNSSPVLSRLVNMHFVRREANRFYLHPIDREYALSRFGREQDEIEDSGDQRFTLHAARLRAADYFRETRKPRESWKNISDISPQLNEFDLRCAAGDYETALAALLDVDYRYLYPWGYYQQMVDMHSRVCKHVADRRLQQQNLGNLGIALAELGRVDEAVVVTEQALEISKAAGYENQASIWLGNLGTLDSDMGRTLKALARHEEALAVARRVGSPFMLAVALGNIGCCHGDLGRFDLAGKVLTEAVSFAITSGDIARETVILANLAEVKIDAEAYEEAKATSTEAIVKAEPADIKRALKLGRKHRALACLLSGDSTSARTDAETACECDLPQFNHACTVLLGLIAVVQKDTVFARQALEQAIAEADKAIAHNKLQFRAYDSKALALACMAVIRGQSDLSDAVATHKIARTIADDAGVVKRLLRLYKLLACSGPGNTLLPVCQSAAGPSYTLEKM